MLIRDWERAWAPYSEATYETVLASIRPHDVVLEIGAGDLRLARRLARKARQVFAWEIQPRILALGLQTGSLPHNLTVVCTDARTAPIPPGITVAVLLMRHCRHYRLYTRKLHQAGCLRLLTNARWRMGVEIVDLTAVSVPFATISLGWYACNCGQTGFVPGQPEKLTPEQERIVYNVRSCPKCQTAIHPT